MKKLFTNMTMAGLITLIAATSTNAQTGFLTEEYPMMKGVSKNIKNGWQVKPLVTIGETNNAGEDLNLLNLGYRPMGILDGIGAYRNGSSVHFLVNNETSDNVGYTYNLANGTPLIGARIVNFEVSRTTRTVLGASLAYNKVYDRAGIIVTSASQINEGLAPGTNNGFNRFCGSYFVGKNVNGFTKDIYLTGEETTSGQLVALEVATKQLHVAPMAGRAGWENVTSLTNYSTSKVVLMFGDDRSSAPLILYIGEKGTTAAGYTPAKPFLKNNGLANGHLYVWVSDISGETTPAGFYGTGTTRSGKFVRIDHFNSAMAGTTGYDALGFVDQATQDALYDAVGHFEFSRPEDLSTNPLDQTQVVLASTGNDDLFGGVEAWGVTYLIDLDDVSFSSQLSLPLEDINNIAATITILYDGNDAGGGIVSGPDFGLRSPDNIEWSSNGYIYINEDRSIDTFGLTSGIEASLWQLEPSTGAIERILEMDRNAVPFQQLDNLPADIGNWESSGVLDVTSLFVAAPGETILVLDAQAHSITTGPIGGSTDLVQGGQLLLASKIYPSMVLRSTTEETGARQIENKLTVYPVPANEVVYLDVVSNVRVYDVNGSLLITEEGVNSVDVSALPAGVYILNTDTESVKIVIE